VIRRYRTDIALSLLHQWILLGTEPNGSRALADTMTDVSAVALGALLDGIADVFNSFAIPRLMRLNAIPVELWPKLVHGDIEHVDVSALATAVSTLAQAGILVPDQKLERKLREIAGLPEPEYDEGVLPTASATPPPIVPGAQSPALKLLQRLRDEAHRFAITGHRRRRARRFNESVLETVPGMGPAKRRALLQHFGGLQGVMRAGRADLEAAPGIGPTLAQNLYDALHPGE
jgi:hypothetical protein